jgi:hypothetical protein
MSPGSSPSGLAVGSFYRGVVGADIVCAAPGTGKLGVFANAISSPADANKQVAVPKVDNAGAGCAGCFFFDKSTYITTEASGNLTFTVRRTLYRILSASWDFSYAHRFLARPQVSRNLSSNLMPNTIQFVRYLTVDGTAKGGVDDGDYTTTEGVLMFEPGETEQAFEVGLHDDADLEAHLETFSLVLYLARGNGR